MTDQERIRRALSGLHASKDTITEVLNKMANTEQARETRARRVGRRAAMIAAAAILALALGVTALAVTKWTGFALTDGMGRAGVRRLLESASTAGTMQLIEPDGTTHYLDENGRETLVLSAEEARRHDMDRLRAWEDAVRGSTTLVDVDTMDFIPGGVTELAVAEDGAIPDFALGNGYMVVFYPEGGTGWALSAGDAVTLTMTASEECHMEFKVFRDGTLTETENAHAEKHSFTYTASEPGAYCFGVVYTSASADNFTDCRITVE